MSYERIHPMLVVVVLHPIMLRLMVIKPVPAAAVEAERTLNPTAIRSYHPHHLIAPPDPAVQLQLPRLLHRPLRPVRQNGKLRQ